MFDDYAPKRVKLPIERNPVTRQVEICVSGWWKWVAGIAATLVTASIVATVTLLFSINRQIPVIADRQEAMRTDVGEIRTDVRELEAKVENVRTDRFTGRDARELEDRLRGEMKGN